MIFTHRESSESNGLLNIRRLDKREVLLDLFQRPARTDQAEQVLYGEPVTPDTRLAPHFVGLDRDAVKDLHGLNVP